MKKQRTHKFVDKYPLLSGVLGTIILFLVFVLFYIVASIINNIFGSNPIIVTITTLISLCLTMLIYKWWFSPEYEGSLKGGNLKEGFMLCIPFGIYWLINIIVLIVSGDLKFNVTFAGFSAALTAGIGEEIYYRIGSIPTMFKGWSDKKRHIVILLVSSVVFGLSHITNVFAGAELATTMHQVYTSFCHGLFFGALFIRCGNIIPAMFLHFSHDLLAIWLQPEIVDETGVMIKTFSWDSGTILDTVMATLLGICGILYVSYRYADKIEEVWKKKWSKKEIVE